MKELKEEHVRLADFSHMFTTDLLRIAQLSLKDPEIQRPGYMGAVPGLFRTGKNGLQYVDTLGVARTIVPHEKREALVKTLWALKEVPRGQESFFNYINSRFIGIQMSFVRDFVAKKSGIQFITSLQNPSKKKRAVRANIPFSHISCDLADFISFSERRGQEEERFVLLVSCDFSGYLFVALLPEGKTGPGVARHFEKIVKKIKKLNGKPRILTSDLGTEFHNHHFQAVCKKHGIKHLKPKTGARIAPYVENRVRVFKRYVRLNSHLLFENTRWYEPEVLAGSCRAVNNIQRQSGFSAKEIVDRWRKGGTLESIRESYTKDEKQDEKKVGVSELSSGDYVRVRVAPQKINLAFKSHLGFQGDSDFEVPVSWSKEMFRVTRLKRLRVRRTTRYKLTNGLWYDRSQLLKIPANTEPLERMPRVIPEKIAVPGRRSSRLARKKQINYKE